MPSVTIAFRKEKGRHQQLQQKQVLPAEGIFDNCYKS